MPKYEWHRQGDANHYVILQGYKWITSVQFNGELSVHEQERQLTLMVEGLNHG